MDMPLRRLTVVLFLLSVSAVQAQTIRYVAPAGTDDANDCSSAATACATIMHAIVVADPGDTIDIGVGTYTEANIIVDRDLTLRGVGMGHTIVQAHEMHPEELSKGIGKHLVQQQGILETERAELHEITQDLVRGKLKLEEFFQAKEAVRARIVDRKKWTRQASMTSSTSSGRVFTVPAGVTASMKGMTVRHGCADTEYPDASGIYNAGDLELNGMAVTDNGAYFTECGGGVYNSGTLEIDSSSVSDNFSYMHDGAGINNDGGTLAISNSTINANRGDHFPSCGGILNRGEATIVDTEIAENGQGDGSGGGICTRGTMTLLRSVIRDNYARWGVGGGILARGTLTIIETTIADNWSWYADGGIRGEGTLVIERSTIRGNSSPSDEAEVAGSALSFGDGETTISNSTFSDNSGAYAAIVLGYTSELARVSIQSSTISDNSSGGIYVADDAIPGERIVEIKNTILAENYDDHGASDCRGAIDSHGFNLIGSLTDCTISEVAHTGSDQIGVDPLLGPLLDNGGPTLTHGLDAGSPAVDAGTCLGFDGNALTLDQRSFPREEPCDIGAFELQVSLEQLLSDLAAWIAGLHLPISFKNALLAKLRVIGNSIALANTSWARSQLQSFVDHVLAYRNKIIDAASADRLVADARRIIAMLEQGSTENMVLIETNRGLDSETYSVSQNYPNPFNPWTEIAFDLPQAVYVQLIVYDLLGREVERLVDGLLQAGRHRARWNANALPSGVYSYKIDAGTYKEVRQMVLMR